VAGSLFATVMAAAPDAVCDRRLKPAAGQDGYALREDGRCEGFYERAIGSTSDLFLAALWEEPLAGSWPESLRLSWLADTNAPVRIVATALGPRDYYQMDAVADPRPGVYAWPTTLVRRSGLLPRDIGLVAFHDSAGRVYLPLTTSKSAKGPRTYRLILICGADLTEVSVEVRDAARASISGSQTYKPAMGFYPSSSPIRLQLPPVESGTHRVTLSAAGRRAGASGALVFVMYAP
jgi:hypothetical protein